MNITPISTTEQPSSFARMRLSNPKPVPSHEKHEITHFNILLVEDNPGDIVLVEEAIAETPASVSIHIQNAQSLLQAVALLDKSHFDIVLLDLSLPDSKGIDTLIHLESYVHQFPMIILTDRHDDELARQVLKLGAQDCLSKRELCGRTLLRSMRHAVERHQLRIELKQTQQQCHKQQQLENLGLMAKRIAHDFNNLLAGISGNTDLLALNGTNGQKSMQYLTGIVQGCHQGSELCDQLLNYSGKGQRRDEVIDINQLVKDLDSSMSAAFPESIKIEYALTDEPLPVEVNSTQIRQVVMNFLKNAVDAIENQTGRVSVSTEHLNVDEASKNDNYWGKYVTEGDHYVHLKVEDTGCGMDQQSIAHIFDPFYTTKKHGKGLGLASALGIVQAHEGAVKVESQLGVGTTFHLLLPTTDKALTPKQNHTFKHIDWEPEGAVLIIDDNNKLLGILEEYLNRIGLDTIVAKNGKDGIDAYRSHKNDISIILLDSNMPNMSGQETYTALHTMNPDTKFILMSGYNQSSENCVFIENKENVQFMKKPFQLDALKDTIARLVNVER